MAIKISGTTVIDDSQNWTGTAIPANKGGTGTTDGSLTNNTVDGTNSVGFRGKPQLIKSLDYTLVLTDAGKHILHPSADTTARTFTIPANSSVAYPVGTEITFVNQVSAGTVTVAITTDTMYLEGAGTTGSITLAPNTKATAIKITSTQWLINKTTSSSSFSSIDDAMAFAIAF